MKEVSVHPWFQRADDGARQGGILPLARNGLALTAAVVLLVTLVAACGGGGDDDDGGVVAVKSTFTPTPPDFTPVVLQTRSARETAFAQESTAQANTTPTAPSSPASPRAETPLTGTPAATPRPGEIRPPDAVLRTGRGDLLGIVGDSNYLDPVSGAGAKVDAPYVPLQANALSWAAGAAARVEAPNSPYPVGSATAELYTYNDNVALPQSTQGVPTGEIAFYAQTDPAQQATVQGPNISITPQVAPGDYILAVRIVWAASPEIVTQFGEQYTQYIYVVKVE